MQGLWRTASLAVVCTLISVNSASAGVLLYGDEDVLGTRSYDHEPTDGATLEGLTPGATSVGFYGLSGFGHVFPFSPGVGEFPGTDQIYAGSHQTGQRDGYAGYAGRLQGPQVFELDYSSLVGPGDTISTLTLGIAFDDFQFPGNGNPYLFTVNGTPDIALGTFADTFALNGPAVGFGTIGIDTSLLTADHKLIVSIDQSGDGGDGWAVDFLTVGITTNTVATPEPTSLALLGMGAAGLALSRLRRRTKQD